MSDSSLIHKKIWFILKEVKNYGPFSCVEMMQMLENKLVFEHDSIWREGLGGWHSLAEVFEFSQIGIAGFYREYSPETQIDKTKLYRRRHSRVPVTATVTVLASKNSYAALCLDVSKGGARLMIDRVTFKPGNTIEVCFKPSEDISAFTAQCKVVNKNSNIYGVEYIQVKGVIKIKGLKTA